MAALHADQVLPGVALRREIDVLVDMVGAVGVVRRQPDQIAARRRLHAFRRHRGVTQHARRPDLRNARLAGRLAGLAHPFAHRQHAARAGIDDEGLVLRRPAGEGHVDEEHVGRHLQRLVPVGAGVLALAPGHRVGRCEGGVDDAAALQRDLEGVTAQRVRRRQPVGGDAGGELVEVLPVGGSVLVVHGVVPPVNRQRPASAGRRRWHRRRLSGSSRSSSPPRPTRRSR